VPPSLAPGFALLLAAHVAGAAEPLPAVSYDTRGATTAEVEALKTVVDAGFWLETGDALLVAAPSSVHSRLARRAKAQRGHGLLAAGQLFLLPMGCEVDRHPIPNPIAVVGRHALVRMPPALAARIPDARAVRPDSVLAREYRPAAGRKGTPDSALQAVVDRVDPARWFSRLETLAGWDRSSHGAGAGGGGIDLARDWLVARFAALGMASTTPVVGGVSAGPSNVIAVRPGTDLAAEWVLVGAHYDARNPNDSPSGVAGTPGAEDNASGCAGVLEMATVFAAVPTRRSLVFACYAGEEQGLYGSIEHVQATIAAGEVPRVKLAVIMDMIGYSGDTDFDVLLESAGTPAQLAVLNRFAALAADHAPGLRAVVDTFPCCSDHVPWINAGVPTLLTIENDWSTYPHYHRATDLPRNITNAQAMGGRILRMNAAGIAAAAELAESPLFASGFEGAPNAP
jgi:hypothetical protein